MEPTWHRAGNFHMKGKPDQPSAGRAAPRGAQGTLSEQAAGVGIPHPDPQMLGWSGEGSTPSILLLSPRALPPELWGCRKGSVGPGQHCSPWAKAEPGPCSPALGSCTAKILPTDPGAGIRGGMQPACAQSTQMEFCDGFRHTFTQEVLLLWAHAVHVLRARAGQCL